MPEIDPGRRDVVLASARLATHAGRWATGGMVLMGLVNAVALAATLQDLVYLLGVSGVPSAERAQEMNERAGGLANVGWLVFAVGTMTLNGWLQRSTRFATTSGAQPRAATGFALLRPYYRLRALEQALDPARVVVPPSPETKHGGGYREPAVKQPGGGHVGPAPLLAWWLLWLASTSLLVFRWAVTVDWTPAKEVDSLAAAINVVFAMLGCVLVTRLSRRLTGRARRLFPSE